MIGRHAAILAVAIVLMTTCAGCDAPAPAASAQSPASSENHAALEARIKALETLLPSQSHLMADVVRPVLHGSVRPSFADGAPALRDPLP